MSRTIDDITMETPTRLDFFVEAELGHEAKDALLAVGGKRNSINIVSVRLRRVGQASRVRFVFTSDNPKLNRSRCLWALDRAEISVLRVETLDLIYDIADEDLRRVATYFGGPNQPWRKQRDALAGDDILGRLLYWVLEPNADKSERGKLAWAAGDVVAKDPAGPSVAAAASAISSLAAENTRSSCHAAGNLLGELLRIAQEQGFGLPCAITEAHVLPLIEHPSWHIHLDALGILGVINGPRSAEAEAALLRLAAEAAKSDRDSGIWASSIARALGSCHDSDRVRIALRTFLNHPNGEARSAAAYALVRIGGREEARSAWQLFMEQRSPSNRYHAEVLIDRYGEPDDVDYVAALLGARLRKIKVNFRPVPQAGHLIQFLSRQELNETAASALELVTKRFDRLADPLQEWLRDEFPDLVPVGLGRDSCSS